MSKENATLLRSQNSTIKFEDGTPIKYLAPNKSYNMLGVHINPMLDFRDHLKHITSDRRKLAKVLTKRLLSPNRKKLVIKQLLKSNYHATHLGIFTDKQLEKIDTILDKAARNALEITPSFPTKAIHGPTKKMGLGYAPMKDRANQMGIEHITEIINEPTDKGYIAYIHTTRVANTYHHRPKEAYEATQARLLTLRVLSYLRSIPGAELEHIQNLQTPYQKAITIRSVSKDVDMSRASRRHIPKNLSTEDYSRQLRT